MSFPRYRMRPEEVDNRPAIILPVVVLPHPDSPTRHNTSPAGMLRLTSSTALMVCPLTMKVRITCSRVISGSDPRFMVGINSRPDVTSMLHGHVANASKPHDARTLLRSAQALRGECAHRPEGNAGETYNRLAIG